MALTLEIVGAEGVVLRADELDRVVARRREEGHHPGSEVALYPGHAPLLMQTEPCRLRTVHGGLVGHIDVGKGVLEICDDEVTLVLT